MFNYEEIFTFILCNKFCFLIRVAYIILWFWRFNFCVLRTNASFVWMYVSIMFVDGSFKFHLYSSSRNARNLYMIKPLHPMRYESICLLTISLIILAFVVMILNLGITSLFKIAFIVYWRVCIVFCLFFICFFLPL